jgi:hypothetical protein
MKSELPAIRVLWLGLTVLVVTTPMFGHHSGSMWDRERRLTLKGSVTLVNFSNPHVQIHFEAKDGNGNAEEWTAESGPPQRLYRAGWNADTLKPGDAITVMGVTAKDGRKVINIRELVGPKGQTLFEGAD